MLVIDNFFGPFSWNTNSFPVFFLPLSEVLKRKTEENWTWRNEDGFSQKTQKGFTHHIGTSSSCLIK